MIRSLLVSIPTTVIAWGGDGHDIITRVAVSLISTRTENFLENFIGTDFAAASRWADSDEASIRYPESQDYHFSHTPYRECQPFNFERDCGFPGREGLCIVTGLADAIGKASDPRISRNDRVDALKFVLHFVGDIHQPLHTGFAADAGGTKISLSYPNMTLHELWDYGLIASGSSDTLVDKLFKSVNNNGGKFIERISNQANVTGIVLNGSLDRLIEYAGSIASETTMTATCSLAYSSESGWIESGDVILDSYLSSRGSMMQIQLAKAAVRLSIILEAIAHAYSHRLAEMKAISRDDRIEKLFERLELESRERAAGGVHDPLSGDRFAALAIDFVVDEYLFDSDESMGVSTIVGMSKKAAKALKKELKRKETIRLKNREKREEKRRISQMVDGIDLNTLVLIKRGTRLFITEREFVTSRYFAPRQNAVIFVKFSNQDPEDEPITFLLDSRIFVRKPSLSFMTRMFRALKGEEESDTEPGGLESLGPVSGLESLHERPRELDAVSRTFIEKFSSPADDLLQHIDYVPTTAAEEIYLSRFKSTKDRLMYEGELDRLNVAQLTKFDHELVAIIFEGTRTVFVSTMSNCRRPNETKFILNRYAAINSAHSVEKSMMILIDARVFDQRMTDGVVKILRRALMSPRVKQRVNRLMQMNPKFIEQLHYFIKAIGGERKDVDITALVYLKDFRTIERPDRFGFVTFAVDFEIDPSRAAIASFFSKMMFDAPQ